VIARVTAIRAQVGVTNEEARQAEEERYRNTARERLEAVGISRRARDVSSPRSFEYAVMELPSGEAADYLNKAGSLGWELVGAIPGATGHVLYMKRDVWLASEGTSGRLAASAFPVGRAAAPAGGMTFSGFYYESGSDLDADGDVDGGLIDDIQNLFG
jgi:hypothetical protein